MTNRKRVRAFTLIELLLVMVILVVLSSVVGLSLVNRRNQADLTATKSTMANLQTALRIFEVDCGRFPSPDEGLEVLLIDPGINGWHGPYIDVLRPDPWGTPYIYVAPGEHFPESFDLLSYGPDKRESTDDVTNWQI